MAVPCALNPVLSAVAVTVPCALPQATAWTQHGLFLMYNRMHRAVCDWNTLPGKLTWEADLSLGSWGDGDGEDGDSR